MTVETNSYTQLQQTVNYLKEKNLQPEIGVVLGTGLHRLLEIMEMIQTVPYTEIPNFPVSTVEFHKGNLVYGNIAGKKVVCMQGRFHVYEGYSMQQVVFPVRVMQLLGIRYLLLTNAAGGINLNFKKGDLVLIEDHINQQFSNPLVGKNIDELGIRFPDMSQPYSKMINNLLLKKATDLNIPLKQGVYVSVNGPMLETKAEYRFLKTIGADMVGMSTVPEVIAANHMNLPCAAISVITDECNPDDLKPVDIQEIIRVAATADSKLATLLRHTIMSL